MSDKFVLGKYYPGSSFVHRLDPRVKFFGVIVSMVSILMVREWQPLLLLLVAIIGLIIATRIPLKPILQSIKPVVFITVFAFVLNLFQGEGRILVKFWRIAITDQGLLNATIMASRLVLIVVATTLLLTLTTTPMHLADALEQMMKPLKKFGFPAHEIAMMTSIALRFVPTLMEETDKIMKAQSSRGADYDTGTILQKARGFVTILVPLFISALRRADELAQAMEARCYRGGDGRTKLHQLKFKFSDLLFMLVMLLFNVVVIYLHFVLKK